MSKTLYFTRHGQTVWNVENKICGATDSELTELGRQQARELGERLKSAMSDGSEDVLKIDEILYSPLIRAKDTALIIAKMTGIPAREEARLIEQNFGKWEGTPRNGADFKVAKRSFVDSYDGGESMLRLAARIYSLLDEIRQEPGEKTYLLVAHNGIARMIESYFRDMTNEEYAAYGIKNCELVRYNL